jgi:hypothetical protein
MAPLAPVTPIVMIRPCVATIRFSGGIQSRSGSAASQA